MSKISEALETTIKVGGAVITILGLTSKIIENVEEVKKEFIDSKVKTSIAK